jgi:hypothetical protein
MKVKHIEEVRKQETLGEASPLIYSEFMPFLKEKVAKFLRDNQAEMGDEWVRDAHSKLYLSLGKNQKGELIGSNIYIGAAIATLCPEIPLIEGQQLLALTKSTGSKTPFGPVYVDFGCFLTPEAYEMNPFEAGILAESFKKRGINLREGKVPNFNQLKLVPDKKIGLVFKLADNDNVREDRIADVSDYPFYAIGKKGLFRACLSVDGWYAVDDRLAYSSDYGRMVRYDKSGVAPQKLSLERKRDLVYTLMSS